MPRATAERAKMRYLLNRFRPETWTIFRDHGARISGVEYRYRRIARERVKPGDVFLCYLFGLKRWCGALYINSEAFEADDPIFGNPDPYTVRCSVRPLVLLEPEFAIPIDEPCIWNRLSLTRSHKIGSSTWTGPFRNPLKLIEDADGDFLMSRLIVQHLEQRRYP